MIAASALVALALALPLVARPWWLAAPALAWGAALLARDLRQILLLLAAALTFALALPVPADAPLAVGAALLAVGATIVPLVRALGPGRPAWRALLVAAGAPAGALALALPPQGRLLLASDLAGGVVVLAMAAGLLVALVGDAWRANANG